MSEELVSSCIFVVSSVKIGATGMRVVLLTYTIPCCSKTLIVAIKLRLWDNDLSNVKYE